MASKAWGRALAAAAGVCLLHAANAAAEAPAVSDASDVSHLGDFPPHTLGCYVDGQKFTPVMHHMPLPNVPTAVECNQRCFQNPYCSHFNFYGSNGDCYLVAKGAVRVEDPLATSGPKACATTPSWCSQVPDPAAFPGTSTAATNEAWLEGLQPPNLQCWPYHNGDPGPCEEEPITVLEDSSAGWNGVCQGLKRVQVPLGETCAEICTSNPFCAEYAVTQSDAEGTSYCYQGLGDECYHKYSYSPTSAQRLMHGHYRVVRELVGIEVGGLVQMDVFNEGGIQATPSNVGIQRCNITCLSLLNCQIWQYYSTSGCWIENPAKFEITYPATTKVWSSIGSHAQEAIAGQFIQRLCNATKRALTNGGPVEPSCADFQCPSGFVPRSFVERDAGRAHGDGNYSGCCAPLATCSSVTCPALYSLRSNMTTSKCSGRVCTASDILDCCELSDGALPATGAPPAVGAVPATVDNIPSAQAVPAALPPAFVVTSLPTVAPTSTPTGTPTSAPTSVPTTTPTSAPTFASVAPTTAPTLPLMVPPAGAQMSPMYRSSGPTDGGVNWPLLLAMLALLLALAAAAYFCCNKRTSRRNMFADSGSEDEDDMAALVRPGPGGLQPFPPPPRPQPWGPQQRVTVESVSHNQQGQTLRTFTELVEVPEGTPGAVPMGPGGIPMVPGGMPMGPGGI